MSKTVEKLANQWTDEELILWGQGELVGNDIVTEEELAKEVFYRLGSTVPADAENVVASAKQQIAELASDATTVAVEQPEPTPEPVVEVKEEVPVAKEEKPKPPAPKPTPVKPTPAAPKSAFASAPVQATKSAAELVLVDNLDEYVKKMAPGVSHVGNEGAAQQVKLFRTIQTVLRQEGAQFTRMFSELLAVVHRHRDTVFHERYLYRYFDAMALTSQERRNFERVLNLLITTANPATRGKATKQVDIDATMTGFKNPEMHQRVVGFYSGV